MKYVLITPARNEEAFIEKTLASMVAQTLVPERWVIVDDGSTDRTGAIVQAYVERYPWIELVQRPQRQDRNFAGKAHAFNAGLEQVRSFQFEVIGNLDADISFEHDYFEFLLSKFAEFPRLGVAGTAMREANYDAVTDSFYNDNDVFGACQLFRRTCFEQVGGYTPIKWGGIDWVAVRTARLKGWQTRSFRDKLFYHHRPMGATEANTWKARFDYGRKDYFLGNHPFWQVFRVSFQMMKRPYVVGGLLLLSGYFYSFASRIQRPVAPELLRFHRREQLERLKQLMLHFLKTGRLRLRS
ncbi:MAG: glycosyltransferase family 2 protein [Verrucomicrobia bacterium]|nr:MAG: glycosyltransferase family 2 protein [Verrucomicrobiota bacterium]